MENNFKNYTVSPDGRKMVHSAEMATKRFAKKGCHGKAELCLIMVNPNKYRLFWVCIRDKKVIATLPVFKEEENIKTSGCLAMQFCEDNEMICHDDVFYVTVFNDRKHLCLKMVQCFLNEKMVRAACALHNRQVVEIKLVSLYDDFTRKYLSACWQVTYVKDELDSGFFFVDLRDGIVLEDYDFSEVQPYTIGIGYSFLAYDTYYTLRRDVNGLYVSKNHIQLTLGEKF